MEFDMRRISCVFSIWLSYYYDDYDSRQSRSAFIKESPMVANITRSIGICVTGSTGLLQPFVGTIWFRIYGWETNSLSDLWQLENPSEKQFFWWVLVRTLVQLHSTRFFFYQFLKGGASERFLRTSAKVCWRIRVRSSHLVFHFSFPYLHYIFKEELKASYVLYKSLHRVVLSNQPES